MAKKMQPKPLPRIIAGTAFAAMLIINLLSLKISSIALMVTAGVVSLALFAAKQKGGSRK